MFGNFVNLALRHLYHSLQFGTQLGFAVVPAIIFVSVLGDVEDRLAARHHAEEELAGILDGCLADAPLPH